MSDAELITAAPADIASLRAARQDAFERGWKAGIEAAAKAASWAHMVPPDGGSPTEGERLVAEAAADAIRSLTPPEDDVPQDAREAIIVAIEPHCGFLHLRTRREIADAAIAALQARGWGNSPEIPEGWRAIETAPKDGTAIMLANCGGVWIGKWVDRYPSGYVKRDWTTMMLNHRHIEGVAQYSPPTHWMPLPAAPVFA